VAALLDEMKVWVAVSIEKWLVKDAMEWQVNIMVMHHMMGTWLIKYSAVSES
jgi:hypothetical protein